MSVDLYAITKYAPDEITPARIGLGTDAFPWPHATSSTGWTYEGARLELTVHGIARLTESASLEGIAPADARSCVFIVPYWYTEGIEYTVASALGGIATSDIALSEGAYEDEEASEPQWSEPSVRAMRELRAALYADRYPASTAPDLDDRATSAAHGDADQLALFEMWIARGNATVRGERASRRADVTAARQALRRAADVTPSAAIAALLG